MPRFSLRTRLLTLVLICSGLVFGVSAYVSYQSVATHMAENLPPEHVAGQLRGVAMTLGLTSVVGLGLMVGMGWFLSEMAVRPARDVTKAARALSAEDLSQRLKLSETDSDFQDLAKVINRMLDQLESSFDQAQRFSADAAHELKTPLMVLQGDLERGIQESEAGSEQQQRYGRLLEEVQHLKTIIQKLLLLSQADSGRLNIHAEAFDLSGEVEAIAEDFRAITPQLTIAADIEPDIRLFADKNLLIQLLHNLVSNAVKYNEDDGRIRMQLKKKKDTVRFRIANSGTPIQEEHRDKIFDRFFKGESSRFRRGESSGLGLSLCLEITRAHGGDLKLLQSNEKYTVFEVTLPV